MEKRHLQCTNLCKRPSNAFILFTQTLRPSILAAIKNRDADALARLSGEPVEVTEKLFTHVATTVCRTSGMAWKKLDAAEKQKFYDKQAEVAKKHAEIHPNFTHLFSKHLREAKARQKKLADKSRTSLKKKRRRAAQPSPARRARDSESAAVDKAKDASVNNACAVENNSVFTAKVDRSVDNFCQTQLLTPSVAAFCMQNVSPILVGDLLRMSQKEWVKALTIS